MNTKKVILIAVSITVFVIAIFLIAYLSNLPIIDPLLSDNAKEERVLRRAANNFPNIIGTYSLVDEDGQKVRVLIDCHKIEDNAILRETGRTGDACMETFSALYGTVISSTTATTTRKIVKVNLSRFTESADMLQLLVEKSTQPDTLNDKPVFRTAPFRLGWSPASKFDLIITEEGESAVSSTTSSIKFEGTATGDNDVTKHFISKYPPNQ